VVARDGDSIGDGTRAVGARSRRVSVTLTSHLNALALRVENSVSHLVKTVSERVIMSVFVVISHSRLLVSRAVARILNSFLGNLHVFTVCRCSLGCVESFLGERDLLGESGTMSGSINGSTSNGYLLVILGSVCRGVNGGTGYTEIVFVD